MAPTLRFAGRLLLLWAVFAALAAYPLYKLADPVFTESLAVSAGIFFVLTVISFHLLNENARGNINSLLGAMGGGMLLKLVVALVYVWIFIKSHRGNELAFLVPFFIGYFINTAFELFSIMSNLRRNS